MKRKYLYSIILVAGLMFVNFSVSRVYGQTPQNKPSTQQITEYTCSMHPEVIKDKPGNCPVCGMKLVEKKNMHKGEMQQPNDSSMMKHDQKKMMCDSTTMKKSQMMPDSTSVKHDPKGM
ncbi:heavy metal-binding domain-containing protein [Bacteroidota bacterium]